MPGRHKHPTCACRQCAEIHYQCRSALYPRGIAIDEQNDVAPANKFIDYFSLCCRRHAATAMQSDDRGKRAYTLGLGQIPLYVVAPNEPTRNETLRGAFKLYALQRRGPCVGHQRTSDAP